MTTDSLQLLIQYSKSDSMAMRNTASTNKLIWQSAQLNSLSLKKENAFMEISNGKIKGMNSVKHNGKLKNRSLLEVVWGIERSISTWLPVGRISYCTACRQSIAYKLISKKKKF